MEVCDTFHRISQLSWLPVPYQCYVCGRVKQCSVSAVSVLLPGNLVTAIVQNTVLFQERRFQLCCLAGALVSGTYMTCYLMVVQ